MLKPQMTLNTPEQARAASVCENHTAALGLEPPVLCPTQPVVILGSTFQFLHQIQKQGEAHDC